MNRIKVMGLCLVAVFALAAVAASSASASPGWYECAKAAKSGKLYTGNYVDKLCATPATKAQEEAGKENKYTLKAGIGKGKGFKGKSGATTLWTETPLGITAKVTCTGATDSGKLALPNKEYDVVAIFKGCETGGNKCASAGAKAGEIKTNNLAGELVDIASYSAGGAGTGVVLGSEAGPESPQVVFSCKVVTATVYGGIIGRHTGDLASEGKGVNKEATTKYEVGPNIGEVSAKVGETTYKWTPIVNTPFVEGSVTPVILESGLCGEEVKTLLGIECAPPIPSGQEQTAVDKGEALEIQ